MNSWVLGRVVKESKEVWGILIFWRLISKRDGLPTWLSGKESACQCRRRRFNPWVRRIPWRRPWQPTPVFCLGNPMDRGAWWAIVHRAVKSQTWLSNWACMYQRGTLPFLSISHLLVPFSSSVLDCIYLIVDTICILSIFTFFRMRPCSKVIQLASN